MKTKICTKCKKKKFLSKFYKNKNKKDGLASWCKDCMCVYSKLPKNLKKRKKWWSRRPEKITEYNLKRLYGITIEYWDQMFQEQHGCCAICGKHQSELKKRFDTDHSHKSGKVRQLLCHQCNSIIGYSKESIEILESVIDYLRKHNGQ